jgi:hypothetical protein
MTERSHARVRGRPPAVGAGRRFAGRVMARLHGYADGFTGSIDRATAEVYRYKEHGEEAGRRAAHWWADVRKDPEGECASLRTRIDGSARDESRLLQEVGELRTKADGAAGDFHDEARLRDRENQLDLARREQRDLKDRLHRAEAQLDGAYHMARTSAEQFKDYYEGLMYSYCAANRNAPAPEKVPMIELPSALEQPTFGGPRPGGGSPPIGSTPDDQPPSGSSTP